MIGRKLAWFTTINELVFQQFHEEMPTQPSGTTASSWNCRKQHFKPKQAQCSSVSNMLTHVVTGTGLCCYCYLKTGIPHLYRYCMRQAMTCCIVGKKLCFKSHDRPQLPCKIVMRHQVNSLTSKYTNSCEVHTHTKLYRTGATAVIVSIAQFFSMWHICRSADPFKNLEGNNKKSSSLSFNNLLRI